MQLGVRPRFLRIALFVLLATLLFALIAPNLLRRRMARSEISPQTDICNIHRAVKAYTAEKGALPPTMSALRGRVVAGLSCDAPPCEYRFYHYRYTAMQGSGKPRYSITAHPVEGNGTSFYVDETGVVRYTLEDREATSSDRTDDYIVRPCKASIPE